MRNSNGPNDCVHTTNSAGESIAPAIFCPERLANLAKRFFTGNSLYLPAAYFIAPAFRFSGPQAVDLTRLLGIEASTRRSASRARASLGSAIACSTNFSTLVAMSTRYFNDLHHSSCSFSVNYLPPTLLNFTAQLELPLSASKSSSRARASSTHFDPGNTSAPPCSC